MAAAVGKSLDQFSLDTNKLGHFLSTQNDVCRSEKLSAKNLFDFVKSKESKEEPQGRSLPELIVDQFDDEQVWQQLELQNEAVFQCSLSSVTSTAPSISLTCNLDVIESEGSENEEKPPEEVSEEEEDRLEESSEEEKEEEYEEQADSDSYDEEGDDLKDLFGKANGYDSDQSEEEVRLKKLLDNEENEEEEDNDDEEEGEEEDSDSDDAPVTKVKKSNKRKTVLDDKFFNVGEMEAFLDQEDKREERKRDGKDLEGDGEDYDVWADQEEEDEDGVMYQDFFDTPENEAPQKKRVRFNEEEDSEEEEEEEEEEEPQKRDLLGDSEDEDEEKPMKSSYQQRIERIANRVDRFEAENLGPKPWHQTGEVENKDRPDHALLEEDLPFDYQSQPVRLPTEEFQQSVESILRARIKDKVWDDVERKVKPKDNPYEYKKRLVLDQEKSKESLAAVYEGEYLKQANKEEEEKKNPDYEEIKKMMTSLFVKLDALSNFQFTPKPAAAEMKVINNLPAVAVEEVQPVSVSDAQLLAPEEIKDKATRDIKGDTEKTKTDKNRARKQKKKLQRLKQKRRDEVLAAKANKDSKVEMEEAQRQVLKKSKTEKGVKIMKEGGDTGALKSSSKFFNQLQEKAQASIAQGTNASASSKKKRKR